MDLRRPCGKICRYNVRQSDPAALKILALDTSTEYCSVALSIDGESDFRGTAAGQTHSQLVLRMVDELLRARALSLHDLDGIAYGEGPGSFTGLRIACGVVQGLAFGANLRVVGVGTLLAMAVGTGAKRVVCCIDARMQEIYHAAYEYDLGSWHVVHEPSVCPPAAAPALSGPGWLGCGSGFVAHRNVLQGVYARQLDAIEPDRYPHAREIAQLALPRFRANEAVSCEQAAPVYLRDKVALRTDERAGR
jgi:tRNA threonylcarbamoyladenosine biosynthesis protein TsaB